MAPPNLQIANAIALDQIAAISSFLTLVYKASPETRAHIQNHLQLWLSYILASDGALNEAVWPGLWSVDGGIFAGVLESVVEAQVC